MSISISNVTSTSCDIIVVEDCGKNSSGYWGMVYFMTINQYPINGKFVDEFKIKRVPFEGVPTCTCTLTTGEFVVGFKSGNKNQFGKVVSFDKVSHQIKRIIGIPEPVYSIRHEGPDFLVGTTTVLKTYI